MLSSLGARRERSRSPSEAGPPSKVFIQEKNKPEHLRPSDTKPPTQESEICLGPHHSDPIFVPKIVVQEYREEKMVSPPMPYTYAQALTGTRSSPEEPSLDFQETVAQNPQKTQHQDPIPQQFLQQDLSRRTATETEEQQPKLQQSVKKKKQEEMMYEESEPRQHKPDQEHRQTEQLTVTNLKEKTKGKQKTELHEKTSQQQLTVKKPSMSSQELQSRKAQAMKNRPWLQKGDKKTPGPHIGQDPAQTPNQTKPIKSQLKPESATQVVSHSPSTDKQPESHTKLSKETKQVQEKQQKGAQQQRETQQRKQQKEQQQQQKQLQDFKKQQAQPVLRQAKPDSHTKTTPWTVTEAQYNKERKIQNQSQPNMQSTPQSGVQVSLTGVSHSSTESQQTTTTSFSQTGMIESQPQIQALSKPHASTKKQSLSQTSVPAGSQLLPQLQSPAHGPPGAQVQTWTQISPSSPVPGLIQPPVPSHIQLRTHPQSWASVRAPSPKPPTNDQSETIDQAKTFIQTHSQLRDHHETCSELKTHSEIHVMSKNLPQIHSKSGPSQPHVQKTNPQTNNQSNVQVQSHVQQVAKPSDHQPPTHKTKVQPMVYLQDHPVPDPKTRSQVPVLQHGLPTGPNQDHPGPDPKTCFQPSILHGGFPTGPHQHHPVLDPITHSQPPILQQGLHSQGHLQAWNPVQASSLMSPQHLQTAAQPQLYHQGYSQFSSQHYTEKQESQSQAIFQQRHPVSQLYPQAQSPMSQAFPAAPNVPQWPQQGPQVTPHGFSHMGLSYTPPQINQAHTQTWSPSQPQINLQSPVQLKPHQPIHSVQTEQGHVQQQTWLQAMPHIQSQPYHHPQTQQHLTVQHTAQIQTHITSQSQPPHQVQSQLPLQGPLQTLQARSQTGIQTQTGQQVELHTKASSEPKPSQLLHPLMEKNCSSSPQSNPLVRAGFELTAQPKLPSTIQSKSESEPKPQPTLPKPVPSSAVCGIKSLTKLGMQKQAATQPSCESEPEVQPPAQPLGELPQSQVTSEPLVMMPTQVQNKSLVLTPAKSEGSSLVSKLWIETPAQPVVQSLIQPNIDSTIQPKVQSVTQPKPEAQLPQTQLSSLSKPQSPPHPKVQSETVTKPVAQSLVQPKSDSFSQPKGQSVSQPKLEGLPQTPTQSETQSPTQTRLQAQPLPPSNPQIPPLLHNKPHQQQTSPLFQVPQIQAESPEDLIRPPALAQAPPQAYTEAYVKARALAMNGFEEAKHCLQAHILEAISVFKDKCLSAQQTAVKEVNVTSSCV